MGKKKKTPKALLIIVLSYGFAVVLVASILLYSAAKYRSNITAQTETKVAELNAALLESLTKKQDETGYEQTLLGSNTDVCLWDLYPGMPVREYSFVVTNGTDTDAHATVDMEFSVMLRTMENVPLKYTLLCNEKEYPAQQSPYPTVIADEHRKTSDTDWCEYTFYEYLGSPREAFFRLTSTDLSMLSFKLRVEWPVTDTNVSKPTNDASYMNEIEIINLLIKLNSSIYYDVPVTPVIGDDDVSTVATIVLMPKLIGGTLVSSATDLTYNVSYDAFKLVDGKYRFDFTVTNGNRLLVDGINVTTFTDFTVRVRIPLTYYTQSMAPMNLIYRDEAGAEIELSPSMTDYIKYDILPSSSGYGAFVSISPTDVPIYESATDTDLQYCIYTVFSYDIPATCSRLVNRRPSDTDLAFTAYDVDLFTLVCANDSASQTLIAGSATDRIDEARRRFCILIDAVFAAGDE